MAAKYVIGVDGGTESIRAGVFDLQGKPLAFSSCPYATNFPHPGWAEQSPAEWWAALGTSVREAVAKSGVPTSSIAAISLDTTNCTVVALDQDGQPLRPALLWMDMRSAEQAAQVLATGDVALEVNSGGRGPVSAEWMIGKALWIKQNEPQLFESATYICEYQDYMNYHLTGRMTASISNVSVRWHYNNTRGWPVSLLEKLGLSELLAKWPQEVLPLAAPVGHLTASAAAHLGLPEGLLVAQGGSDAFIGMVGLGVVRAGQMAMLTGSSHLQLGMSDEPLHGQGFFGTYLDAVIPGLHVIEGGQTSTGSVVRWLNSSVVGEAGWPGYESLNAAAAELPPGCEGLLCCDHFQGNRTPHTDAASRGAFVGLTLKHKLPHLFRSVLEGVAFGTEVILDTMRHHGYHVDTLTLAGGATKSDLWLQIHADVSNLPLILTEVSDAPALGCAILAAVAAGLHPSIHAAVDAMVHTARVIQPDPQAHHEYQRFYRAYKALYPSLKVVRNALEDSAPSQQQQQQQQPQQQQKPQQQQQQQQQGGGQLQAIISPSILAADFANLASELSRVEAGGADWVHVDMFDGTFAPNFTIGPPVVAALRKHSSIFLDCHLAVSEPAKYVPALHIAGASGITFQIEPFLQDTGSPAAAAVAAGYLASRIRSIGMRAGVALAVSTGVDAVMPLLQADAVDMVMCMTVECGFGGQKFQEQVLEKVKVLRSSFPALDIQVDGGVNRETARLAAAAGANVLVAGTAVFGAPEGPAAAISALKSALLQEGLAAAAAAAAAGAAAGASQVVAA